MFGYRAAIEEVNRSCRWVSLAFHKFTESGDENAIESIFFASRTIRGFDVSVA
jgi:hypothetical protein